MSLPPGPELHPIKQTRRWMRAPTELLTEAAAKFGDVFTMRLVGLGPMVMVHAPAGIKKIFAADPDELRAGEANSVLHALLGDNSVLILDGPMHRRQRRLLMPPFHGERMRAYSEVMRAAALRSVESWPKGEPFALHARMQAITLDVILRAVFGIDGSSDDGKRIGRNLSALLDSIASPILLLPGLLGIDGFRSLPFLPMSRRKREADADVFAEIARRRKSGERGEDILSLLLETRDEDGKAMTDQELRDELMTLLVAGHETTATSLAWTLDLLLHDAAEKEKLDRELAAAPDLAKAPVLDSVVKEALRLRPVLPLVQRKLHVEFELLGHTLPVGARVSPCIWLTHRRADLYPEPERFKADRFVGRTPDPSEWLPFGGANRRCLGAAFAIHEMKIVLATILANAKLEAASPDPEPVARRSITFSPKAGTRVIARAA